MSLNKLFKSIVTILAVLAGLFVLAIIFSSRGARDFEESIINDYEYSDAGGYEKTIVYSGNERSQEIIIDSRVDEYRVEGDKLWVARRPRVSDLAADGALDSRLLPTCEYWVIDTKTHKVEKTSNSGGLHCN